MPEVLPHDLDLTPNWLTKEYIEDKLQNLYEDINLKVKNFLIKSAAGKGENFASIMTRIQVDFTTDANKDTVQTGSYIVKLSFEKDEYCASVMNQYKVFEHEMKIYEKILPKLSALLGEINDNEKIFANTIHVDYEHDAIIFEDLSTLAYTTLERSKGLDLVHTKAALRKLAKMHATAAVLNERSPGIFQNFSYGIFNQHTRSFETLFTGMFEECARFLESGDESLHEYAPKIRILKNYLMDYAERVYEPTNGFFRTLTHGDFWVSNVMFKYNDSSKLPRQPDDVVLIDFQFSCWSSPAVDLHYLFNTSVQEHVRLYHQDELVQCYYNILADTLKQLRYAGKIPTLHEFQIQVQSKSFLGKLYFKYFVYKYSNICI